MKIEPLNFWDLKCSDKEIANLVDLVDDKDLNELVILRSNFIIEINEISDEIISLENDKENEASYYEKRDYMYELSDKINYISHVISDNIERVLLLDNECIK